MSFAKPGSARDKGTVSVFSSDPLCKDGNVRFIKGILDTLT